MIPNHGGKKTGKRNGIDNFKAFISSFFVLILLFLLIGCSNPIPEDKLDYVGEWRSKEMVLLILQDGSLKYERLKRGGTTSITGPIKAFEGDDFVVGIAFLTTTFEVSKPPHEMDGVWKMEVDGVTLTRTQP
jgi:hypothetical protein